MQDSSHTAHSASAKNVLIVDDEQLLCWTLEEMLKGAGMRTTCRMSVLDAIATMRTAHFDLVITDYRLPDGSGYEVASFAKHLSRVSKVIMLTAESEGRETTLPTSSVDEIVDKPFDIDAFMERVCGHLGIPLRNQETP